MGRAWTPDTWTPDINLVDHARLDGFDIRHLNAADRSWVVAGLACAGITANESASALHCSLRLVHQIRSQPMTAACAYAINLADELAATRTELARTQSLRTAETTHHQRQLDLLTHQRGRLINDLATLRQQLPPPTPPSQPHERTHAQTQPTN